MHIAIDARIISSTTGRYVERLLHYLEKIDTTNQYTVLVKQKDVDYWKPSNPNFSIKIADFKNYSLSEQVGYLKLLRSLKADLVHFCQPEQPVLYRGNKITTIHDFTLLNTYNPDKNWFVYHFKQLVGQFVFRSIVKRSNYILTPTDYTKKELFARYPSTPTEKVVRAYLAAETRTTTKKPYPVSSKDFIMYVGQQSRYKNIQRLGDAHQILLEKHPDLQLILVGKIDNSAKINQEYFASKHYKNITFTGFVDDDELNWLYTNCSAYIFPSLFEGFGLPGLEAMIHNTPVVSSNASCLPEVYGDAAHYFDPLNCEDIARSINEVLQNKKLREKLITNGQKQLKKYSWEKTAEKTLAVYRLALKK